MKNFNKWDDPQRSLRDTLSLTEGINCRCYNWEPIVKTILRWPDMAEMAKDLLFAYFDYTYLMTRTDLDKSEERGCALLALGERCKAMLDMAASTDNPIEFVPSEELRDEAEVARLKRCKDERKKG